MKLNQINLNDQNVLQKIKYYYRELQEKVAEEKRQYRKRIAVDITKTNYTNKIEIEKQINALNQMNLDEVKNLENEQRDLDLKPSR